MYDLFNQKIERSNLLSEVQLSYKSKVKASERQKLTSSLQTYEYLNSIWDYSKIEHVEEMLMLMLNRANKVLGWAKISMGGSAGTVCDPKIVFQFALLSNASSIIISHNHPSGNLTPSQADINLTSKMKAAGKLLDIEVLDHVIMTAESYYSFTDEGMMN